MLPRVHNCCCGCSLATGVRIIAIFELVIYSLALVGSIIIVTTISTGISSEEDIAFSAALISIFFFAGHIAISAMLLSAVNKMRPDLMKPWLIYAGINICFILVVITLNSISYVTTLDGQTLSLIISYSISIALTIYWFIVVYSYYKSLQESNVGGIPPGMARSVY